MKRYVIDPPSSSPLEWSYVLTATVSVITILTYLAFASIGLVDLPWGW